MNKLLQSKIAAFLLLAIVVAAIIFSFKMRNEWWMFGDVFCAFMMAFTHLMALTIGKINRVAARQLEYAACIFGVLFVIAFLLEFFIFQTMW